MCCSNARAIEVGSIEVRVLGLNIRRGLRWNVCRSHGGVLRVGFIEVLGLNNSWAWRWNARNSHVKSIEVGV